MDKVARYIAWNMMMTGSLVLASIFKLNALITILSVFFVFEALVNAVAILFIRDKKIVDLLKKMHTDGAFKLYKVLMEPVYIIVAFTLGYPAIGACMFFTACAYCYQWATIVGLMKEEGKSDTSEMA